IIPADAYFHDTARDSVLDLAFACGPGARDPGTPPPNRCASEVRCKTPYQLTAESCVGYDGAIMMAKTQITLETEMQRRARQRANDLGVSLAEYFRRLVARDLARPETAAHVDRIFDLGSSGDSDIASQKDSMIAEAFHSTRRKLRRRR